MMGSERTAPALLCLVTVAAGLALQQSTQIPFADKAGDVLYAALIVFVGLLLLPRARVAYVGAAAFAWCAAIELLQLTAIPSLVTDTVPLARLVLGSGFDPLDLPAYAVGVVLAALASRMVARRRTKRRSPKPRPPGSGNPA